MNLEERVITKRSAYYKQAVLVLKKSFPPSEILPMWYLNFLSKKQNVDFIAYYDSEVFVGVTYSIFTESCVYLFFFAVDTHIRSQGYGSKILELLKKRYDQKPITLNIEEVTSSSSESSSQSKRALFYEKNDFHKTGFYTKMANKNYDILCYGKFNKDDFSKVGKQISFGLFCPTLLLRN